MVSWHSDGADSYFLWTNSYVLWAIQRLPSREEDFTSLLDIISFPSIHWYFSSLQSVSFLNGAPINWWVHIPSLLYQVSPCLFTLFVNSVFLSPCNVYQKCLSVLFIKHTTSCHLLAHTDVFLLLSWECQQHVSNTPKCCRFWMDIGVCVDKKMTPTQEYL